MGRVKMCLGVYPSRRVAWDYDLWFRHVAGILTSEAGFPRLTAIPLVACNGCSDKIAPFRPTAIVIADLLITE